MSKLTTVRKSLETNSEAVIAKVFEKNYLFERNGYLSHTMDFWVAPKNGLYTVKELQEFMISLVPNGMEPTERFDFRQCNSESELELGKLYFEENIGQEKVKRICTITDEELLNVSGFVDGEKTIEEVRPYKRIIGVLPFPSEAFVGDFLEGKLSSSSRVRPEDLKRYQPKAL